MARCAAPCIDGGAFAGDSPVATEWYTKIGTLDVEWQSDGRIDGAVISCICQLCGLAGQPGSATASINTCASIDGFDRRGHSRASPVTVNAHRGGPTGLPGG